MNFDSCIRHTCAFLEPLVNVHLLCSFRVFVVHLSCICCAFVYSKLLCTLSLYDHDSGSHCMTVFTGITWYISHVDIHFDTAMTAVDMSCMNSFIVDVCFVVLYRLLAVLTVSFQLHEQLHEFPEVLILSIFKIYILYVSLFSWNMIISTIRVHLG